MPDVHHRHTPESESESESGISHAKDNDLGGVGTLSLFPDIAGLTNTNVIAASNMGNLVLRAPTGPIQPYGSAGVGVVRVTGNLDVPFLGPTIREEERKRHRPEIS